MVLLFLRSALSSELSLASELSLGAEKHQVGSCGFQWLILYDKGHRGLVALFFLPSDASSLYLTLPQKGAPFSQGFSLLTFKANGSSWRQAIKMIRFLTQIEWERFDTHVSIPLCLWDCPGLSSDRSFPQELRLHR